MIIGELPYNNNNSCDRQTSDEEESFAPSHPLLRNWILVWEFVEQERRRVRMFCLKVVLELSISSLIKRRILKSTAFWRHPIPPKWCLVFSVGREGDCDHRIEFSSGFKTLHKYHFPKTNNMTQCFSNAKRKFFRGSLHFSSHAALEILTVVFPVHAMHQINHDHISLGWL